MKPEYNHGSYSYTSITLLRNDVGYNTPRMNYLLRRIDDGKIKFKDNVRNRGFFAYTLSLNLQDEDDVQMIVEKLDWAGAKPTVKHQTWYYAFPSDTFPPDSGYNSKSFHKELTNTDEYSLSLWAKANNIEEAYRMCMFRRREPAEVIRVWAHRGQAYSVDKSLPDFTRKDNIEIASWQKLQSHMQKFWTAKSWLSKLDDKRSRAGKTYLFEGWRNGKYKVLFDYDPDDNLPFEFISYDTIELFTSLGT